MKQSAWSLVLLGVLTLTTSAGLYQACRIETLLLSQQERGYSEMTTTWTSVDGDHELVTTRGEHNPNETPGEHAARHRAELTAMQEEFEKIETEPPSGQ